MSCQARGGNGFPAAAAASAPMPLPYSRWWMEVALDAARDGVLIESAERVVYANGAYAQLLGYRTGSDLLQRVVAELVSESDAERVARFSRLRREGKPAPASYEFAARHRNGSAVRLEASVSISTSHGKLYIMTIVRPFAAKDETATKEAVRGAHEDLSPRERQVMALLIEGHRPKAIALELGLTENTIATHRSRLLQKLGASDNRELYQYALRHGLITWT